MGREVTYDPVKGRAWLRQHAYSRKCRECTGGPLPRLGDCVVRAPCICPACHRVWSYSVNISQVVTKRVVFCAYAKRQPFLMSDLPGRVRSQP